MELQKWKQIRYISTSIDHAVCNHLKLLNIGRIFILILIILSGLHKIPVSFYDTTQCNRYFMYTGTVSSPEISEWLQRQAFISPLSDLPVYLLANVVVRKLSPENANVLGGKKWLEAKVQKI